MSEQKKAIVEEMGFGALRHIPSLNVLHKLSRELILFFDLYKGFLETRYEKICITPTKIRDALGLNSSAIILFSFYICIFLSFSYFYINLFILNYFGAVAIVGANFPEKFEYNKPNEQQKKFIDSFKSATLASLTKSVIEMSVEGEKSLMKFKRTFTVFIQKYFLLPTRISIVSPIHKPPVLHVETVRD
ncbi:hypothetical protein AHAS_Ahas20G0255100 [Arachis hypogaea]